MKTGCGDGGHNEQHSQYMIYVNAPITVIAFLLLQLGSLGTWLYSFPTAQHLTHMDSIHTCYNRQIQPHPPPPTPPINENKETKSYIKKVNKYTKQQQQSNWRQHEGSVQWKPQLETERQTKWTTILCVAWTALNLLGHAVRIYLNPTCTRKTTTTDSSVFPRSWGKACLKSCCDIYISEFHLPRKTTTDSSVFPRSWGKECLRSSCLYISESHLHQKKQRSPTSSPGLGRSPTCSFSLVSPPPPHPPYCGHVWHGREAGLWAGKCWRMCSGSRGRVSQGHSIICVGNLQALHSQQFPFCLPLSPWDGTAGFPNTPRLPFRHLPAKLEGGCCKPVLAVWSVPYTGTAGLALEAGSLWNWPIRDS